MYFDAVGIFSSGTIPWSCLLPLIGLLPSVATQDQSAMHSDNTKMLVRVPVIAQRTSKRSYSSCFEYLETTNEFEYYQSSSNF